MNIPTTASRAPPEPTPKPDAETVVDAVSLGSSKVFETYKSNLSFGMPHPGNIAESGLLSSIPLPPLTYPCDGLFGGIVEQGKLSKLQLEGVLYAGQHHHLILGDGRRAGFFIGDGAGVGKGRQIAGVIADNCSRNRLKHVWFSTSTDLYLDAQRDLQDLGCHLTVVDGCQALSSGSSKGLGMSSGLASRGVLFSTYSTLVSTGGGGKGGGRLQQIIDWCGGPSFDGCLVFDEAHKAKNFVAEKGSATGKADEKASSKVSTAVVAIQAALPQARVVYASATGVSDISNLVYADRLGLWGRGTPFSNFLAFEKFIEKRGLGGLEMLAMEMKASGMYVSRGLSWKGAEFSTDVATLSEQFVSSVYDTSVAFMARLRKDLQEACSRTNNKQAARAYWGLHIRFFKELCVAAKVDFVASAAREALESGHAVVIGLQTTGEAGMDRLVEKKGGLCGNSSLSLPGFVSTAKQSLLYFIESNFPTEVKQEFKQPANSNGVPQLRVGEGGAYYGGDGSSEQGGCGPQYHQQAASQAAAQAAAQASTLEVVVDQHCVALRSAALSDAQALDLPGAPLDCLIDALGGPSNVAEMTGRKGRVVRVSSSSSAHGGGGGGAKFKYVTRAAQTVGVEMDKLNVNEKKLFNDGKKNVAIISDAASTGISLHAARSAKNQKRRVHFTIELPWSAEKAIQQLGRTHRSNQLSAPLYRLVVTNLGGEKRFASSVARRLMQLGALTRGDRRAAIGGDWTEVNQLESKYGKQALATLVAKGRRANLLAGSPASSGYASLGLLSPTGGPSEDFLQPPQQTFSTAGGDKASATGGSDSNSRSSGSGGGCGGDGLSEATQQQQQQQQQRNADLVVGQSLDEMGFEEGDDSKIKVKSFLNRLLGLTVASQNSVFASFSACLVESVGSAKEAGTFDEGVADLKGSSFKLKNQEPEILFVDKVTNAKTVVNVVQSDRGVTFKVAVLKLSEHRRKVAAKVEEEELKMNQQGGGDDGSSAAREMEDDNEDDEADEDEEDDGLFDSDDDELDEEERDDDDDENGDGFSKGGSQKQQSSRQRECSFFVSKKALMGRGTIYLLGKQKNKHQWLVTRPNTGLGDIPMDSEKLEATYQRVLVSDDELSRFLLGAKEENEEEGGTGVKDVNGDKDDDDDDGVVIVDDDEGNKDDDGGVGGGGNEGNIDEDKDKEEVGGGGGSSGGKAAATPFTKLAGGWDEAFKAAASDDYKHGKRLNEVAILGGAILPVWQLTESLIRERGAQLTTAERNLRVVRVTLDGGSPLAGVKFPPSLLPQLRDRIATELAPSSAAAAADPSAMSTWGAKGAMGGGAMEETGACHIEALAAVDPKAVKVASTAKPTITSFFGKAAAPPAGAAPTENPKAKQAQQPLQKQQQQANASVLGGAKKRREAGVGNKISSAANNPFKKSKSAATAGASGGGSGSGGGFKNGGRASSSSAPGSAAGISSFFQKKPITAVAAAAAVVVATERQRTETPPPGAVDTVDLTSGSP